MSTFSATKGRNAGQYWPTSDGVKRSAVFYCPRCGKGMALFNHDINPRGVVTPSVVEPLNPSPAKCPDPCCGTFHEHLVLLDWPTPEEMQANADRLAGYYDGLTASHEAPAQLAKSHEQ